MPRGFGTCVTNSKQEKLTVNSPVTASKPTCMVCSKSEGGEISGRSLSRSFFLPPEKEQNKDVDVITE